MRLEDAFGHIHQERMAGLPILNPRLRVQAVGFRAWEDGWLGVLVTPWMMNLLFVPGEGADPSVKRPDRVRTFPSGSYELLATDEPSFGAYEACSLFSPMQEFSDQDAAVAVAEAVMETLLTPAELPMDATPETTSRRLSRRDLLRGHFKAGD